MSKYKTIPGRLVVKEVEEKVVNNLLLNESDKDYKTVKVLSDYETQTGEIITTECTIFIKLNAGTSIRDILVITEGDILTYETL